jgi:hypothetical protein
MFAFFASHFLQYNYAPPGHSFWEGAVWPNVVVITIVAPLGWLWSKTRFWPLRPIKHALHGLHLKMDAHHSSLERLHGKVERYGQSLDELHAKHDALAASLTHPKED